MCLQKYIVPLGWIIRKLWSYRLKLTWLLTLPVFKCDEGTFSRLLDGKAVVMKLLHSENYSDVLTSALCRNVRSNVLHWHRVCYLYFTPDGSVTFSKYQILNGNVKRETTTHIVRSKTVVIFDQVCQRANIPRSFHVGVIVFQSALIIRRKAPCRCPIILQPYHFLEMGYVTLQHY